jgi:adenylate cyclase
VIPKISEHQGRIVKTIGDGVLVEFVSVVDAIRCDSPGQTRIDFRIGIKDRLRRIG